MTEMREYDIGVELLTTVTSDSVALDVSSASTIQFRFLKPDGVEVTKMGSFKTDGTDGKVKYVTADGDLDTQGIWRYQVRVILSGGQDLTSTVAKFKVTDAIGKPE